MGRTLDPHCNPWECENLSPRASEARQDASSGPRRRLFCDVSTQNEGAPVFLARWKRNLGIESSYKHLSLLGRLAFSHPFG